MKHFSSIAATTERRSDFCASRVKSRQRSDYPSQRLEAPQPTDLHFECDLYRPAAGQELLAELVRRRAASTCAAYVLPANSFAQTDLFLEGTKPKTPSLLESECSENYWLLQTQQPKDQKP